jgi:5-methylthioadenosine/S-adenosylhomocysteine deaminase
VAAGTGVTAPFVLRADRLWGPTERRATPGHVFEIAVSGGRIAAVTEVAAAAPAADGAEALGGVGFAVLPGLVNGHTHLAMTLLRGVGQDLPLDRWLAEAIWPREAHLTPADVYWGTLLGLAEGLLSGTTWFSDMYLHEEQAAEAALAAGVRADLAVGLAGEGEAFDHAVDRAVDLCRAYDGAGSGRLRMRLGPHAPYTCPPASLRRVAHASDRAGLGLHIHLSETRREVEESLARHGATPVQVAVRQGIFDRPVVAAHVVYPRPEDLPHLAAMAGGVAHCPGSNLQLGSGVAPTRAMADAGITLAVGTDGPASAPGLDLWQALRLAWLLPKGANGDPSRPTADEVLRWGTAGGARALGRGDYGGVAAGAAADLVAVDLRGPHHLPEGPLAAQLLSVARPSDVRHVVVDGRLVVRDGHLLTVDLDRVRSECVARAARLATAAGT